MKGIPIKFRGKCVKDDKIVYGWGYKSECPMSSFPAIIDDDDKYNAVYPDSVAQLVGYDDNGAEVYEGDKVQSVELEYFAALTPCLIIPNIEGFTVPFLYVTKTKEG